MVVAYANGRPDERLAAELQAVIDRWTAGGAAVELRDDSGRTLERFGPPTVPLYDDDPPLPDAEVERRLRESSRTTLAEFWKRMGAA